MKITLKPIHQQVVVLFGATSGIGLQTAIEMARQGARVALVGREQSSVDQAIDRVRQEIGIARVRQETQTSAPLSNSGPLMGGSTGYGGTSTVTGGAVTGGAMTGGAMTGGTTTGSSSAMMNDMVADQQVIGLMADASHWEEVKAVADQVVARFGRIDTWVQAASVSEWALFEETTPDEFRQVIDVNLTGMAFGAMAALPYLKQQGGALIFISSVAGRMPIPYQSAYSAAKHGVVALSNILHMEMKHEGLPVSVTNILPASVNTPLFSKGRTRMGVEPKPIPPVYSPELVSKAIIYAAQHPIREISVGGAGLLLQVIRRISPNLAQTYMGTAGFAQQRSDQPKTSIAPDNLYSHVEGYNQVEGEYGAYAMQSSPSLWLATHPRARMALRAAVLGGLGFAAYRIIRAQRKPSTFRQVQKQIQHQVKQATQRLPFRREKSRMDRFIELLAGLPLVGLLPFFDKPNLKKRVQRGVQKGVEKLPVEQTQKMLKRAQERIPEVDTSKVAEKIQERIPSRRKESRVKETTVVKERPDRVDVDIHISQREAKKAEKLTSRM